MKVTRYRMGITPLKAIEMINVAIRYAYLSPMGKVSSLCNLMYSYLVCLEVVLQKHRVSKHFLMKFSRAARKSSIREKAILKIMVRMRIEPIF